MKRHIYILMSILLSVPVAMPVAAQCFDMTNLYADNVVCTTGSFNKPYQYTGVVSGRQTVMNDPNAYDANIPQLRCVPPGETAAVRLGNDRTGAQAESITYEYTVDADNTIVLLKYAAVMENPNHNATNQPRLILQILDANDNLIDEDCASFKFVASQALGWTSLYNGSLLWKDWTAVGVDLSAYVGQTVRIRLTNYDCSQGGHYGYAYIHLSCTPKEIVSSACGDEATTTFSAPAGFEYNWYKLSGGTRIPVGNTQSVTVPLDGDTYYCDIAQVGNPDCYYTSSVVAQPRSPIADFSVRHITACVDTLYITDLSGVSTDGTTLNTPHEDCDQVWFDLGDGRIFTAAQIQSMPITYDHSGTFTITQTASLYDGTSCKDTHQLEITVRGEHEDIVTAIYDTVCSGTPYWFDQRLLKSTGIYTKLCTTAFGCDSTVELHLTVNPSYLLSDTMYLCEGHQTEFYGQTISETGIYYASFTASTGCDSIYQLVVREAIQNHQSITATICDNEYYEFNGQLLNEEGDYTQVLTNRMGCDSVVELHLHVLPTYLIDRYVETCHNDTFVFRGNIITTPGIYYDSLLTTHGCDSVFRFIYNQTPVFRFDAAETILQGDSFLFQGHYYSHPGLHTVTYSTTSGCDSVYTLFLTVLPRYLFKEEAVTCANQPYEWRGHTFYESGVYYDSLRTVSGHDSIYQLTLTVYPVYLNTIYVETCEGDPFEFRGRMITASGVYYDSLVTKSGCDSVFKLVYNITPTYHFVDTAYLCKGGSYSFHGRLLTNAGVYYDSLLTVSGCDSVYELHLTYYPTYVTEDSAVICDNESYQWGGRDLNIPGTYVDTFSSVWGCDSISILHLTVHPTYFRNRYISLCPGETYSVNNHLLSAPEEYLDSMLTVDGCDSIIRYVVNQHPGFLIDEEASICPDEFYVFRGHTYTVPGTYTDTLHTAQGCDSIYRLMLSYKPTYRMVTRDTVACSYDDYLWRGRLYSETGIYYDSLMTREGCDSVYVLDLTVLRPSFHTEYIERCENQPFFFRGEWLMQSGVYFDTLFNAAGCDSVLQLVYNITPTYHFVDTAYLCRTTTYNFRGRLLTEPGVYFDSLLTVSGCDSVYELHLLHFHTYVTEDSAVICAGESFHWGGRDLRETGVYTDSLRSNNGCDSISILHLTVNPTYREQRYITLCSNETYSLKGHTLRAPSVYNDTLFSASGCDSIIQYIVSENPNYIVETEMSICPDESYFFRGRTYSLPGVYTDTLHAEGGCDSLYRLRLSYKPSYHFVEHDTAQCASSAYIWHSRQLNVSGVYFDSLVTVDGCDSIYELHLVFNPSYLVPLYVETCAGEAFNFRGRMITAPGIYYDTLYTRAGCDSVLQLVYNVTPSYHFVDTAYFCQGSTYRFRGRTLSLPGVYYDSLQTTSGCDSIYELRLRLYPSYHHTDTVHICSSDPYMWGSRILSQSGVYTDTFQTVNGCDSICVLYLSISPSYFNTLYYRLCPNETFYIHGQALHAPAVYVDSLVSSLGCDSVIRYELSLNPSFVIEQQVAICPGDVYNFRGRDVSIPGTYIDTFQTVNGCDSIYRLILKHKPSYELLTIDTVECGTEPYEWHHRSFTRSGIYYDSLITVDGCDSVYILNLTYHRRYKFTISDTICDIRTYNFRGRTLHETGVYYDSLVTRDGCDSIYELHLTVFETIRDTLEEAVCITDSMMKDDWPYASEGVYIDTVCDTEDGHCHIHVVYFYIRTPSEIYRADIPDVCADDSVFEVNFQYTGSRPKSYSLYFAEDAKMQGFVDLRDIPFEDGVIGYVPLYDEPTRYVRPDYYHVRLEFDNGACEPNLYGIDIEFRVRYPSWIIEQNWNDVIALLTADYNGGYTFSKYQWYVNGRRVDYASGPYIYLQEIGIGDEVVLYPTREGEDYAIPTCPVTVEHYEDVYAYPILVYPTSVSRANTRVNVESENAGSYHLYDLYGHLLGQGRLEAGEMQLDLPALSGCYLLMLDDSFGNHFAQKIMVY